MSKPKVRFKKFTNDWEQRKYEDVIELLSGQDFNPEEYNENGIGIPYLTGASCIENGYTTAVRWTEKPRCIAEKGDTVLVCKGSGYGAIATVNQEKAHIARQFMALKVKKYELDNRFNYFLLNSVVDNIKTDARGLIAGIARDAVLEQKIAVPCLNEQRKIGEYFDTLDTLITLHQRKCDDLRKLKKYMLQKMFPQNGTNVPEIRFLGFTDAWEQRKLGEVVERVTRKNQDLVSELPLTISAQYGLIDQNEFFDKRVASKDVSGYYLIKNGEFAYNKSTSTDAPWGAIKRLDRYENGVLSTLYIVFRIKQNAPINSDFLVSYYATNLWHKGIHEIAAEGARNHGLLNIAPNDFFDTKLTLPQDIDEQYKIGRYFNALEACITLHQHKCDELKKLKNFMLQNMFV